MRIAVTGASGFVGGHLRNLAASLGDEVVAVQRNDYNHPEVLQQRLAGCYAVVNLAGSPINVRWNARNKSLIYHSRIDTTRKLVSAINGLTHKPRVFISTSAIGYYPYSGVCTESTLPARASFLSRVCQNWEKEASQVSSDVRLVILRFGLILGRDGGMLPNMLKAYKRGFGVVFGKGTQIYSWIHIYDLMRIYMLVLDCREYQGIYNCVASNISDARQFSLSLSAYFHPKITFRIPEWFASLLLRGSAALLTRGQNVIPARLLEQNFEFEYPQLNLAFNELFEV